jgi:hypothetical protein
MAKPRQVVMQKVTQVPNIEDLAAYFALAPELVSGRSGALRGRP